MKYSRFDEIAKILFAHTEPREHEKPDKSTVLSILDNPIPFLYELKDQYFSIRKSQGDNTKRHARFEKMKERLNKYFDNFLGKPTFSFFSTQNGYQKKRDNLNDNLESITFASFEKYNYHIDYSRGLTRVAQKYSLLLK